MAYVYGSKVNSKWRAFISYSVITNNDTTYAISVSAGLDTDGSGYSSSNASCTLSGTGQSTYSVSGKKASGKLHVMVGAYTYTWAKGTSAASKTVTAVTKTSGGTVAPGTSTATLTFTVPAKTSYTVSYNANGGSGAPGAQTKWYGTTLTLSSTIPTRTGYTFSGWNTSSAGSGTNYSAGGSYTANAGATLYAKWTANKYTVNFNANGGTSGSATSLQRTFNQAMTITDAVTPTRANHSLLGWADSSTATTPQYTTTYPASTSTAAITLYAVWHLDYIVPVISNAKAYRVSASGSSTETDDGEYIYVAFDYVSGTIDAGESYITPLNCKITIDGTTYTTTLSGSSGSFSNTYGGAYSKDSTHVVSVELYNTGYESSSNVLSMPQIPSATYPIDLLANGDDVYMGVMHPAVRGQVLTLTDGTRVDGALTVGGDELLELDVTIDSSTGRATSGDDMDLYNNLVDLGWVSDVIV